MNKLKMKPQFNLARYKEILELTKSRRYSLFDKISIELLHYQATVQKQSKYNNKENYFSLIERYLAGIIGLNEFHSKILKMNRNSWKTAKKILSDFQKLETLRLADDLEEFSNFISDITDQCREHFEPDLEPISDDEFYNLINNYYLQFQLQNSVHSIKNLAYEKLISRSFKILIWIIGLGLLGFLLTF